MSETKTFGFEEAVVDGIRVLYKDGDRFREIMDIFVSEGKSNLVVISDFDFTLTKYYQQDKETRSCSCHMVLEHSTGLMPESYLTQAKALQQKYHPIEIDPDMDMDVKYRHMEDWVNAHNQLFRESGLKQSTITTAVVNAMESKSFNMRDELASLVSKLTSSNVPLLIFSAGIANVLEHAFKITLDAENLPSNMQVISNRCIFDENDGSLKDFSQPVLHVYNKSCTAFLDHPFFEQIDDRANFLLFGDGLGDLKMSQGLNILTDQILKFGFVNDESKLGEVLPRFFAEDAYDVIILGDPGLQFHNHWLEKICKQ